MDNATRSLPGLYDYKLPAKGNLTISSSLEEAVAGTEWIVEAVPERLDFKHSIYRQVRRPAMKTPLSPHQLQVLNRVSYNKVLVVLKKIIVAHPLILCYLVPLV